MHIIKPAVPSLDETSEGEGKPGDDQTMNKANLSMGVGKQSIKSASRSL